MPETILLMHGFMEDHEVWNNIIPELKSNVVVVDLIGFGNSTPSPTFDFSMMSQARAMQELLEEIKLANIFVLGHSMGGYVSLELSLLLPELKIGLLHSTCIADSEERKINRNKTIEVLQKDASIFIREFYWNLFAEHRKNEFSSRVEELKLKASAIPVNNIIETVKALRDRNDHQSTWVKLTKSSLMIAGTYDKLIDVEDVKRLSGMNHSTFVELKNSGHMGFYEEPEKLIEAINQWI